MLSAFFLICTGMGSSTLRKSAKPTSKPSHSLALATTPMTWKTYSTAIDNTPRGSSSPLLPPQKTNTR